MQQHSEILYVTASDVQRIDGETFSRLWRDRSCHVAPTPGGTAPSGKSPR